MVTTVSMIEQSNHYRNIVRYESSLRYTTVLENCSFGQIFWEEIDENCENAFFAGMSSLAQFQEKHFSR